ncbi:F-box domain protein [Hypoxylon sp. NC1633]|nr:F-box domain protein [Hypoxylon sp. NC1633]
MAVPTILTIPTELVDEIIQQTLPEGFESLALTCKKFYGLCAPSIHRHKYLRKIFQSFNYIERSQRENYDDASAGNSSRDPTFSYISTAFALLERIAIEPKVARYITEADLALDTYPPRVMSFRNIPEVDEAGPVADLLAGSVHLKEAGLDWKEYYSRIRKDLQEGTYYSQHAAAFLLTLLPNTRTLVLPNAWKPLRATEVLLEVLVRNAKRPKYSSDTPSLAKVTRFKSSPIFRLRERRHDLDIAVPFLALPHVQSFYGPMSLAIGSISTELASKSAYFRYGETLETVEFMECFIDEAAIASFLKNAQRLKIFRHSHANRPYRPAQDWDICKFVATIEREVGSHLEELSISVSESQGSILPGKASMRGFPRLRKLGFPLEIAMCNARDAASRFQTPIEGLTEEQLDKSGILIGDLVPLSVTKLSLLSKGTNGHEMALKAIFSNFAAKKASQLPNLEEINISCPWEAEDSYADVCEGLVRGLVRGIKPAGFSIHLIP